MGEGYTVLLWRRRESLDMEGCQLNMLERRPRRQRERHGITGGRDSTSWPVKCIIGGVSSDSNVRNGESNVNGTGVVCAM